MHACMRGLCVFFLSFFFSAFLRNPNRSENRSEKKALAKKTTNEGGGGICPPPACSPRRRVNNVEGEVRLSGVRIGWMKRSGGFLISFLCSFYRQYLSPINPFGMQIRFRFRTGWRKKGGKKKSKQAFLSSAQESWFRSIPGGIQIHCVHSEQHSVFFVSPSKQAIPRCFSTKGLKSIGRTEGREKPRLYFSYL